MYFDYGFENFPTLDKLFSTNIVSKYSELTDKTNVIDETYTHKQVSCEGGETTISKINYTLPGFSGDSRVATIQVKLCSNTSMPQLTHHVFNQSTNVLLT